MTNLFPPAYSFAGYLSGLLPLPKGDRPGGAGPRVGRLEIAAIDWLLDLDGGLTSADDPELPSLLARLDPSRLEGISCPFSAEVHLKSPDAEHDRGTILLLPPWDWPHVPEYRPALASFSLPGDESLLGILSMAGHSRRAGGEAVPRSAREPTDPLGAMRGIHHALHEDREIVYLEPRVEYGGPGRIPFQRVRPPARVLTGETAGNCLDLSLVIAGCLETMGLQPLLFLTGTIEGSPDHAIVGCWTRPGRRFRPLLGDPAELAHLTKEGELHAFEATSVCRGDHRTGFQEAQEAALYRILSGSVHAVDISACRPPTGRVRPCIPMNDPVAIEILRSTARIARRLGAVRQETTHLLYALGSVAGPATREALAASGTTPQRLLDVLDRHLLPEGHDGFPAKTRNFSLALEAARSRARGTGSWTVTETDLLGAIVDSPSRNVGRVLDAAGCDRRRLVEALERLAPNAGEASLSRHVGSDGSPQAGAGAEESS